MKPKGVNLRGKCSIRIYFEMAKFCRLDEAKNLRNEVKSIWKIYSKTNSYFSCLFKVKSGFLLPQAKTKQKQQKTNKMLRRCNNNEFKENKKQRIMHFVNGLHI